MRVSRFVAWTDSAELRLPAHHWTDGGQHSQARSLRAGPTGLVPAIASCFAEAGGEGRDERLRFELSRCQLHGADVPRQHPACKSPMQGNPIAARTAFRSSIDTRPSHREPMRRHSGTVFVNDQPFQGLLRRSCFLPPRLDPVSLSRMLHRAFKFPSLVRHFASR